MHAYISDRERRADMDWFDAQPRPTVGLGQFCQDNFPGGGFQAEDIWHAAALREARAILSETERAVWGEAKTLGFLAARHESRWPDYPCIDCAAGLALTEALTAFVNE